VGPQTLDPADPGELSRGERLLLVVPLLGGLVFGVGPYLAPGAFGQLFGYVGNDHFIYRLAGASTFGYAVALTLALRSTRWLPPRLVVLAVLGFNAASIYACLAELVGGDRHFVVYLILVTSVLLVAISASLLARHGLAIVGDRDSPPWLRWFLIFTVVAALGTGALGLFLPQGGRSFGYHATDTFIYRQAGAATLGYVLMGIYEIRSLHFEELRLPLVMAAVFNGLSLIAAVWAVVTAEPGWLPVVVVPVALITTAGALLALNQGQSAAAARGSI
jgi:hypothetical protein